MDGKVICTCSICGKKSYNITGTPQPGRLVSRATRLIHRRNDRDQRLDDEVEDSSDEAASTPPGIPPTARPEHIPSSTGEFKLSLTR